MDRVISASLGCLRGRAKILAQRDRSGGGFECKRVIDLALIRVQQARWYSCWLRSTTVRPSTCRGENDTWMLRGTWPAAARDWLTAMRGNGGSEPRFTSALRRAEASPNSRYSCDKPAAVSRSVLI